jgi:hypothetical protein
MQPADSRHNPYPALPSGREKLTLHVARYQWILSCIAFGLDTRIPAMLLQHVALRGISGDLAPNRRARLVRLRFVLGQSRDTGGSQSSSIAIDRSTRKVNLLMNYGWEWDLAGLRHGCLRSQEVSRVGLIVRWGVGRLNGFLPVQSVYAHY